MPFDLIHRSNPNKAALSDQELFEKCPAAFTPIASPETTDRYSFIDTEQAIHILSDFGYKPTDATQRPSRLHKNTPYAQHMISFAKDFDGETERPEIILYNSHDGKSSLRLYCGLFRFVCSNNLVSGEGFETKIRHNGINADRFADLVQEQAANLPKMLERMFFMKATQLNPFGVDRFSEQAVALRYEYCSNPFEFSFPETGSFATASSALELQQSQRNADSGNDVFTVMNRLQENLLQGNFNVEHRTQKRPDLKRRKASKLNSLQERLRINRSLWDIAESFV